MTYPFALMGFHASVTAWASSGSMARLGTVACLLAAFLVPVAAMIMAVLLSGRIAETYGALRARRAAYLAVATPPLFTFIGVLVFMAGSPFPDIWPFCALWFTVMIAIVLDGERPLPAVAASTGRSGTRISHGMVAVALLALFLVAHIANHLFGLVGPEAHRTMMKTLRVFYRASLVEPLLLAGFLFLILTGGAMAWRFSAREQDGFRVFQVASGVYLLVFLVSHINAVLVLARTFLGIDSDWNFATGAPTGLLSDAWNIRLVPLYALAVFFALAHPLSSARVVMLAHGMHRDRADSLVVTGGVLAALLAILIVLGMCGLRLYFA
jgi:hypothetical protein